MIEYLPGATPVISLIINIVGQLRIARTFPAGKFLQSVAAGFGAGFVFLLALSVSSAFFRSDLWGEAGAILVVNVGTYIALSYCFFCFINLCKTSLRLRIFAEIQKSAAGLPMDEILSRYNLQKITALRLNRLVQKGHVIKSDGRYFLNRFSLLRVAKIVQGAKILVMGKRSEFS
jgi:hypothetical protein